MAYDDDTRQKDEDAILAARGVLPNTNNFEVLPVGNSDLFGGDQLQMSPDGRAYLASPAPDYSGIPTLGGPTGREPKQPIERQPEPALEEVPPSPRRSTVPKPKTPEQLAREADEMLNRMRAEHQSSVLAPSAVEGALMRARTQTPVPLDKRADFDAWMKDNAPTGDTGEDYDYGGAYLDGMSRNLGNDEHFSDKFKRPNHETFSNESIYAEQYPELAGSWDGDTYIKPRKANSGGGMF